jgi:hypothetical protein
LKPKKSAASLKPQGENQSLEGFAWLWTIASGILPRVSEQVLVRMVQRQDDKVVVDNRKRMAKFLRVP